MKEKKHMTTPETNLDASGAFIVECLADHIANRAGTSDHLRVCLREAVEATLRLHHSLAELGVLQPVRLQH